MRTPKTIDEALEMGFKVNGGPVDVSDDERQQSGTCEMTHLDGRCLDVPFTAVCTFGKPKLNRQSTAATRKRMKHPESDPSDRSPIFVLHPGGLRILVPGKVIDVRQDGQVVESGRHQLPAA